MTSDSARFCEDDFTPLPGIALPDDATTRVVQSLASAFVRRNPGDIASNAPLGNWFVDATVADETVLDNAKVQASPQLFLYIESRGLVCQASPEHIRLYLECRNPWESFDIYVFDSEMKWCIWITHHDDVCLVDPSHLFDSSSS